jgi:hypothetical protein
MASACNVGDGKGMVAGTLFVRSCTEDHDFGFNGAPVAFNLAPIYFVADPVNDLTLTHAHPINHLSIRVQSTGARFEEADVLLVTVANDRDVAVALGQPLPLGPATNVRASLALNQTCPFAEVQAELDGTLTFTAFGSAGAGAATPNDFNIQFGDRLTATFSADVIDRRAGTIGGLGGVPTTPAVAGHLSGNFDFFVRQGKAAQLF